MFVCACEDSSTSSRTHTYLQFHVFLSAISLFDGSLGDWMRGLTHTPTPLRMCVCECVCGMCVCVLYVYVCVCVCVCMFYQHGALTSSTEESA